MNETSELCLLPLDKLIETKRKFKKTSTIPDLGLKVLNRLNRPDNLFGVAVVTDEMDKRGERMIHIKKVIRLL